MGASTGSKRRRPRRHAAFIAGQTRYPT